MGPWYAPRYLSTYDMLANLLLANLTYVRQWVRYLILFFSYFYPLVTTLGNYANLDYRS